MHEWALAEAVVASVERIRSEQGGLAVRSVRLRIGELQAIDREAFAAGLQMSLQGLPYGPEAFQLLTEPASFRCRACRRQWSLEERSELGPDEREAIHFLPECAHLYMRCPGCGSPDFELAAGRGVIIESVDLERELD